MKYYCEFWNRWSDHYTDITDEYPTHEHHTWDELDGYECLYRFAWYGLTSSDPYDHLNYDSSGYSDFNGHTYTYTDLDSGETCPIECIGPVPPLIQGPPPPTQLIWCYSGYPEYSVYSRSV